MMRFTFADGTVHEEHPPVDLMRAREAGDRVGLPPEAFA